MENKKSLSHKIDFAIILRVKNANPNGDPLNGNRPRTDYEGLGEITDVCLKRKIRDRLVERFQHLPEEKQKGQNIFVQSDDRKIDDFKSLEDRAKAMLDCKLGGDETVNLACENWIDVRAFGNLFAYKKKDKKGKNKESNNEEEESGISIGIRGPVTIQSAFSVEKVSITSTQITKSTNAEGDGTKKKSSDRMGWKHRVDHGVYVAFGAMNPQLAERTGFTDDDAAVIKSVLPKIFENDASSARPEGSMEVVNVLWWKHNSKAGQYPSAKVHRSLKVNADGTHALVETLKDLTPEVIKGF